MNLSAEEKNNVNTAIQDYCEDNQIINVQELLDFLIIAHRVNEYLIDGYNTLPEKSINWTELAQNNLFLRLLSSKKDDSGKLAIKCEHIEKVQSVLQYNLKEIMNEGILDSILPFMVKKSLSSNVKKTLESIDSKVNNTLTTKEKMGVKQRSQYLNENIIRSRGDSEIEINVCDAVQKTKKIFRCPKRLLVSKMGYFAEVTKGQRLEDIDISVHCEIPIFDWLIKWVKKDLKPKIDWPILDCGNVLPILVSASFLQMEPLFQECLNFCKYNINNVLSSSSSFSCINDGIITRLSNQFSNCDIENLQDVRDKLKSRLYTKLILDLFKSNPKKEFGHYSTFAYAFHTILIPSVADMIPCKSPIFKIAQNGGIIAYHSRDLRWTLNDHVKSLFFKHKSWRIVYWCLWSECHFMRCTLCKIMYPVKYHKWCQYHPQIPQYCAIENNRHLCYPLGRYPCCNEKTFRYEPLKNPFGCHYKEHVPLLENTSAAEIHKIMQMFPSLTTIEPPIIFSDSFSNYLDPKYVDDDINKKNTIWTNDNHKFTPFNAEGPTKKVIHWWENVIIGISSTKRQFLTELSDKPVIRKPPSPNISENVCESIENIVCETYSSFGSSFEEVEDSLSSFSDSDSTNSDKISVKKHKTKQPPKAIRTLKQRYRYTGNYQWSPTAPMRCNQDNQREYEERCFRQITQHLFHQSSTINEECNRTLISSAASNEIWRQPNSGCYLKLESELLSKIDPKASLRSMTVENKTHTRSKIKKSNKSNA
ncbi:SANT and BTB domain regulator of class switch recombination isoform X2 [Daktulosphaira vitifoliae]|uniref:SANT and BTB domain regulator of class switch recombination isoform X2 n=1 Tax=Daktulosphaira vitifoliae TaxID=58002 RepID=UPI0021AAD575|nr:SANT and BTB domain regulator of class switch recombination isoform X2 [Daktulosphaira vitifoliae]